MIKLLKYLKGYIKAAVAGPLFKIMEAVFELIIPLIVVQIVDVGIRYGDKGYVLMMCGVMVGLGAAGLLFSVTCQYLAARASLGFGTNVRGALYRHINTLSFHELDKFGAPSLVTRLSADVNQAQVGVAMFIRLALRAPFLIIGSVIMAMTISVKLSLIFIGMSIVLSVILYFIMSRSKNYYKKIQEQLDGVALLTRENLSGARVVRAFSKQEEEQRDFGAAAQKVAANSKKAGILSGLLSPLTYAVVNLAIILILWFGGISVNTGADGLSSGKILALVNYLSQVLLSMVALANLIVTFTKSSACGKRIAEVLSTEPSVKENLDGAAPLPVPLAPKISLKNVGFSYGGNRAYSVENISIDILEGQTVGIIGSTGAGKTTLINLILRFYDVSAGEILVDGVNVKNYPFKSLRDKIGYVPQKAALFSGTVRENMLWGNREATDSDIWRALKTAQAEDFVMNQKDGLDTAVNTGGRNFSGGQRQRLTIARALVKNPEILILDDSSSALDYATDAALRRAIRENTSLMTVIIISQRATSLRHADNILVLDDGKCVGLGTYDELLASSPVFQEICSSQSDAEKEAAEND